MELTFDLPVVGNGIPRGLVKTRRILGTVPVEIEVDEASANEMELIAEVNFPPAPSAELTRYYAKDDGLYVPLHSIGDLPRSMVFNDGGQPHFVFEGANRSLRLAVTNLVGEERLYPQQTGRDHRAGKPLHLVPLDREAYGKLYDEGIEDQISKFRTRCARLLVVAGTVFVKSPEPALAVVFERLATGTEAVIQPVRRSFRGLASTLRARRDEPPAAMFRLDEIERLLDFCETVGVDRSRMANRSRRTVIVHNAAMLSLETERATLYASALRCVKKANTLSLPDEEPVDRLFGLVDHFDETDCTDEIGDALREVWDIDRGGRKVFSEDHMEAHVADKVLEMWESRNIVLDHVAPGPATPSKP